MSSHVHRAFRHATSAPGVEVFTFESDRSFPRHSHDQFGVGIIVAGAQRSWSGIGRVEACAGDVITVNPGEMHDGAPLGDEGRRWRMIYFEPTLLADQFAEVARGAIEFESPRSCAPELARAVTSLFQALAAGARDLEFEETLFGSVFPMLARRQKATRPACDSVGVVAAIQRMRDDVCAPWRLRDLAAGAGLSRYQFLRAFARCAGATPHAYLLQLRALKARRRILGGASLAQAAFDSGFADQSHMTRAFVRQFGFTPGSLAAARR